METERQKDRQKERKKYMTGSKRCFASKNEETLETHIVTCEIYKCNECRTKFTTVSDIKKHIKEKHNGKNISLTHLKSNRKNSEFFDDDHHNNSRQLLKY